MQEWTSTDPSRTIRRFETHEEQEMETLRYWRDRPASEKMKAIAELIETAYRMKGVDIHAARSKGPVVRTELGER